MNRNLIRCNKDTFISDEKIEALLKTKIAGAKDTKRYKKAFTMIELIFVIIIIGILAAVAIPRLHASRDDAEVTVALVNIQDTIKETINHYSMNGNGKYYLKGDTGTGLELRIGGPDDFFDNNLYDPDNGSANKSASVIYYYFPGEDGVDGPCMYFGSGNMYNVWTEPKYGLVIWYDFGGEKPAGKSAKCDKLRALIKQMYPPNGTWSGKTTYHVIEFGYRKGGMFGDVYR